MISTLKVSLSVATILEMASSDAATKWKPPAIKWILGFMVAAASTILSIPGCEQPTTRTTPSGVLMASEKLIGPAGPLCHLPSFAHCCSVCWFVDPNLGGTRKTVAQGFIQERPSVFPTQVPHCQLNRQDN